MRAVARDLDPETGSIPPPPLVLRRPRTTRTAWATAAATMACKSKPRHRERRSTAITAAAGAVTSIFEGVAAAATTIMLVAATAVAEHTAVNGRGQRAPQRVAAMSPTMRARRSRRRISDRRGTLTFPSSPRISRSKRCQSRTQRINNSSRAPHQAPLNPLLRQRAKLTLRRTPAQRSTVRLRHQWCLILPRCRGRRLRRWRLQQRSLSRKRHLSNPLRRTPRLQRQRPAAAAAAA